MLANSIFMASIQYTKDRLTVNSSHNKYGHNMLHAAHRKVVNTNKFRRTWDGGVNYTKQSRV